MFAFDCHVFDILRIGVKFSEWDVTLIGVVKIHYEDTSEIVKCVGSPRDRGRNIDIEMVEPCHSTYQIETQKTSFTTERLDPKI